MLTFKEFSCWIEIEGEEAKEYGTRQTQDDNGLAIVTCWIASEAGKQFTVNWKDSVVATAATGHVYVDGKSTNESRLSLKGQITAKHVTQGFRKSASELRPLLFSPIQLTDDDRYLGNSISEHFGEITIHIKRCTIGEQDMRPQPHEDFPEQIIHERSKKAMAHRVSTGASQIHAPVRYFSASGFLDVVKFVFKYRSLDQLIASDIAPPRPPKRRSPVDDAEVIDISDDSGDEEAQLKARLAEIQANRAKKKIKKEHFVKEEDVKPVL